jgi:hypothetical protein
MEVPNDSLQWEYLKKIVSFMWSIGEECETVLHEMCEELLRSITTADNIFIPEPYGVLN